MAASIAGTQKFAALEVVDNAKFSSVIFEDLAVDGTGDLTFVTSGNVSVTSTNTDANAIPSVTVVSTNGVRVYGQEQDVEILAGTIDGVNTAPASVIIGVRDVSDPNAPVSNAVIEVELLANTQVRLGFFGIATPAAQQVGLDASVIASIDDGDWDAGKANVVAVLEQIRSIFNNYGLTTVVA